MKEAEGMEGAEVERAGRPGLSAGDAGGGDPPAAGAPSLAARFRRAARGPRAATAAAGIAALVAALWAGGAWWTAVCAAIALLGAREFARIHGLAPAARAVTLAGGGAVFVLLVLGSGAAVAAVLLVWLVVTAVEVWSRLGAPERRPAQPATALPALPPWLLLGPLYLAVPTGLLARWRLALPAESVLAFLLVLWANDTAAYFVGIAAGRRKLAPRISPGKSWEGAAAGLAAGAIAGALTAGWLGLGAPGGALAGLLATAASQIGDLFESAMKRRAGVKDSGALLPGHGGILDRFDGLLLAAPVAYALVLWGRP